MKFFSRETFEDEIVLIMVASVASIIISLASLFGSENNVSFLAVPIVVSLTAFSIYTPSSGLLHPSNVVLAIGILTVVSTVLTFF